MPLNNFQFSKAPVPFNKFQFSLPSCLSTISCDEIAHANFRADFTLNFNENYFLQKMSTFIFISVLKFFCRLTTLLFRSFQGILLIEVEYFIRPKPNLEGRIQIRSVVRMSIPMLFVRFRKKHICCWISTSIQIFGNNYFSSISCLIQNMIAP